MDDVVKFVSKESCQSGKLVELKFASKKEQQAIFQWRNTKTCWKFVLAQKRIEQQVRKMGSKRNLLFCAWRQMTCQFQFSTFRSPTRIRGNFLTKFSSTWLNWWSANNKQYCQGKYVTKTSRQAQSVNYYHKANFKSAFRRPKTKHKKALKIT